jgi:HK97 family phage major capsid protein
MTVNRSGLVATLQEGREQAGKVILQLRDRINRENRDLDPIEREEWQKANEAYDAFGESIDKIKGAERAETREAILSDLDTHDEDGERKKRRGKDSREQRASAWDLATYGWIRAAMGDAPDARQIRAAERVGVSLRKNYIDIPLGGRAELRAQGVGTDSAGGYLQADSWKSALERALKMYGGPRGGADVIRTRDGGTLTWPAADDTGNLAELLAENTAAAEQDVTLSALTLGAYKYSSKVVRVSNELMEDSIIDLGAELGMMLGERIGRQQGAHFTTGTGTGQPTGILTGAALGKTAASATTFTSDECLDFFHSLDPAYRSDPSCAFAANDAVWLFVRKFKASGTGEYLWGPGISGSQSDRFLGKPALTFPTMSSTFTTGQKLMLFGKMSAYKVRDVNGVRLVKMVERWGPEDQTGFAAFLRSDGKLLNPSSSAAQNPMKYLALA